MCVKFEANDRLPINYNLIRNLIAKLKPCVMILIVRRITCNV